VVFKISGQVPAFKDWNAWYSKYVSRPIFKSEGKQPGYSKSSLYDKFFTGYNCDWLGKVNRFAKYSGKEIVNRSFSSFCAINNMSVPGAYRKASPSFEAGFRSASKYDRPQPSINKVAFELAYRWMLKHFQPHMGNSNIVDKETAWSGMDKNTSAGYPWNLEYHNKNEFFDAHGYQPLDDYWNLIATDNLDRIVPIWTSTVKEELRPLEKLKAFGAEFDRLRTFTASPVEHSHAANRMYSHMNQKFYNSANLCWSFVGATKYFGGFNDLFQRLNVHPNAFALDESSFDASLFQKLMEAVRDARWEFLNSRYTDLATEYGQENFRRHMNLYDAIIHSIIVLETGELVQKHTGNPSGSANTIVDNTMILFLLLAYAWIILYFEKFPGKDPSYDEFMKEVEAALNGDDNTFTVSDAVVGWFNAKSIAAVWADLGVVATTDDWNPRKLIDVDFLSQKFVRHGRMVLPMPETSKVLSSLMYGSLKDDVRWHLMRAYALRIESWPNKQCRSIISDYIGFLNDNYKDQLVGEIKVSDEDSLTMNQIRGIFKGDKEIEMLYCGVETGASGGLPQMSKVLRQFKISFPKLLNTLKIN
jgi:hypothetical protein